MNLPRLRKRFQPRVVGPEGREAVMARFRADAQAWRLQWRCCDCVYVRPSTQACSLHWPNTALLGDDPDVLDTADIPVFCKAFEPACD